MSVRSRRWLIFLLAGLVAVMTAGGSGLIIASAAHASGSQKGVRAQDPVGGTELQDSARVPEYSYDPAAASTTSLAKVPSEAASGDGTRSGSSAAAMAVVRSLVAAEDGGIDLSSATTVSGKFPPSAEPGGILVRRDPLTGEPTNYQEYGPDGLPTKRVDLTGSAHGGIETPHVHEYGRNTNPATGETFVNPGPVRPAQPNEIP